MNGNIQEAFSAYSDLKRENQKWGAVMAVFILPCFAAFGIQKYAGKSVSVLAGKAAIRHYLTYNCAALGLIIVAFAVFLAVFIRSVRKGNNSLTKIISLVGGGAVLIFTMVALSMSINHIASDYKGPSLCKTEEYVLSTSVENNKTCYFLGFKDRGEYTQLQIDTEVYGRLSDGEPADNTSDSDIYRMIKDSGYTEPVLYNEKIVVEYFFYSAIFYNAELVGNVGE